MGVCFEHWLRRRAGAQRRGPGRKSRLARRGSTLAWLLAWLLVLGAASAEAAVKLESAGATAAIEVVATGASDPGLALRGAIAAAQAGDLARSDALLTEVAARYPIIADYADLLRLRGQIEAGANEVAVRLAQAWTHPGSPLEAERQQLLGDALAALGESSAARAAWERAAKATSDSARRASLVAKRAESFSGSGDVDRAVAAYLELWTRHPSEPAAERAATALALIATSRGADPRTARAFAQRGDTLYGEMRNEDALVAFDTALASSTLGASDRRKALLRRAQILFRLRRYSEAIEAWDRLPRVIEYRIERARSLARAGDPLQGAKDLETLGRGARGSEAVRALYLAGLLRDGEGERETAQVLFDEVVRRGAGTAYSNSALWDFGWAAYRERRFDAARAAFEKLRSRSADGVDALQARYWLARTQAEQGDGAAAIASYAAIASEFPLSYYGWRASTRAGALPPVPARAPLPQGKGALTANDLARPQILLEAGLENEARLELEGLVRRARSLGDRLAVANLYVEAGDIHQSQNLVVVAYAETLARGPIPETIELWWQAWPVPFAASVRRATANGERVEPGLVYAVMREESGYRPSVVSISGARGLLQIMPETGERLAREVALASFDADDLFVPEINVRLGSHYLHSLIERFGGQTSAAVASYNAGPDAVARWIDAELDDDEWVESIPYDQTKKYVKRVLRSLYAYRVLY